MSYRLAETIIFLNTSMLILRILTETERVQQHNFISRITLDILYLTYTDKKVKNVCTNMQGDMITFYAEIHEITLVPGELDYHTSEFQHCFIFHPLLIALSS